MASRPRPFERRVAATLVSAAGRLVCFAAIFVIAAMNDSSYAQIAQGRPGVRPALPGSPLLLPRQPLAPRLPVLPPSPLSPAVTFSVTDPYFRSSLAFRWAPVHYQNVKSEDGNNSERGLSDWLSAVDYDGDWNPSNNWEHAEGALRDVYPRHATVYYSVAETSTHWYLIYAFYHPRDTASIWLCRQIGRGVACDAHENDLEGILLAVERPATTGVPSPQTALSRYGSLKALSTVCHTNFRGYQVSGSDWAPRYPDSDSDYPLLSMAYYGNMPRPVTYQEAQGHCARAVASFDPERSTIRYLPAVPPPVDVTQFPAPGEVPSGNSATANYALVDIHGVAGFWARRSSYTLFTEDGHFVGNNGDENSAASPWAWDHERGPFHTGEGDEGLGAGFAAYDPATLFEHHYTISGGPAIDHRYSWMPYCKSNRPCDAEQERVHAILFPPPPATPRPPYVPPGPAPVCDRLPHLPQCRLGP